MYRAEFDYLGGYVSEEQKSFRGANSFDLRELLGNRLLCQLESRRIISLFSCALL